MKIDKQLVIDACNSSKSMAEAASKLDINYQTFVKYAKELGVYKPNQAGKGISRTKADGRDKYPLQDILNGKYPHYSSHKLRVRLIKEGIKENKCECCGITEWNDKPISMHLDHINGNHYDNRLDNLQIVCPNCHSQTDTHGSKKLKASLAQ